MTFQRGLWAETAHNFKANLWVVLFVIGALIAWSIAQDMTGHTNGMVSTIIWLVILIAVHSTILKGQPGFIALTQKGVFMGFLWRSILFFVLGLIPAFLTLPLSEKLGSDIWLLYVFLPAYGIGQALLLSIWGTWFPSVVADGDKTLKAAWERGKKTFTYVFLRLIFCNGLIAASAFGVLIYFFANVESEGDTWSTAGGFDPVAIALQVSFITAFAIQFVMMATVLSRAFLIAERIDANQRNAPFKSEG